MRPTRELFRQANQTYFATFQTNQRKPFFRHERWALAFLETLYRYPADFDLHDFVIMPDHVHLLISPKKPLERAIQLVKGGFSFSARRALEWKGDIWQPGFTDHRVRDEYDYLEHLAYIERNITSLRQEGYRFCGKKFREAAGIVASVAKAKVEPFQMAGLKPALQNFRLLA